MPDRIGTERAYSSDGGIVDGILRFALEAVTCTCESMSPGMSVIPRQSTRSNPVHSGGTFIAFDWISLSLWIPWISSPNVYSESPFDKYPALGKPSSSYWARDPGNPASLRIRALSKQIPATILPRDGLEASRRPRLTPRAMNLERRPTRPLPSRRATTE
eukprot:30811-Pelagococcus_subviridis.AAC.9